MQKSGMRQKSCSKNKLILMIAIDHSQNSSFIPFTFYLFIHAFFGVQFFNWKSYGLPKRTSNDLRNWVVKLSRLSCCITMCRLPVQTPLRAFKGLGSLPRYEAAIRPSGSKSITKNQWSTWIQWKYKRIKM